MEKEDLSTHGVIALVRNNQGKFLLLEDGRQQMKGHWAPPHGRCETSDSSEQDSVIREVQEETGIIARPIKKLLIQAADTKVKTVSFWAVEADESPVMLNEESSDFGWFTVDEALRLTLYPGTRTFFEKVNSGEVSF